MNCREELEEALKFYQDEVDCGDRSEPLDSKQVSFKVEDRSGVQLDSESLSNNCMDGALIP